MQPLVPEVSLLIPSSSSKVSFIESNLAATRSSGAAGSAALGINGSTSSSFSRRPPLSTLTNRQPSIEEEEEEIDEPQRQPMAIGSSTLERTNRYCCAGFSFVVSHSCTCVSLLSDVNFRLGFVSIGTRSKNPAMHQTLRASNRILLPVRHPRLSTKC